MDLKIYMNNCPKLKFDPCKKTHVRGRCEANIKPVLSGDGCGNIHINDKVLFAKFDGMLYAVFEQSESYERLVFQQVQAEAYFKRIDESDILKKHHDLALRLLEKMPTEQAAMFSNITDNKVYGTVKYEDMINVNAGIDEQD